MANHTTSNPLRYDTTTGASWTGIKYVLLIQWVDDNEDIADGDTLSMTINGVTVESEIQLTDNTMGNSVVWQIGPFARGVPVKDFTIGTMDHGVVYVWLE